MQQRIRLGWCGQVVVCFRGLRLRDCGFGVRAEGEPMRRNARPDRFRFTRLPRKRSARPTVSMVTLALATVVATPQAGLADEGGVSFWIPGLFGSLAATPQQAGWS